MIDIKSHLVYNYFDSQQYKMIIERCDFYVNKNLQRFCKIFANNY